MPEYLHPATQIAIASPTSGGGASADGDSGDTAPVSRPLPAAVPRTRIPTHSHRHNRSWAPARRHNPIELQLQQRQA